MRPRVLMHVAVVVLLVLGNLAVGSDRAWQQRTPPPAGDVLPALPDLAAAGRTAALASVDEAVLPRGARALARTVDRLPPEQVTRFGPKPLAAPPAPGRGLDAFRGLSTWIDTYDTGLTAEEQVRIAAAEGVQAVFVQVTRGSSDGWIHDHDRLATVIEASHDAGMLVMVWTVPTFVDVEEDLRRAKAAIAFVTPRGDRPDAFGLDIETTDVADVAERTRRLLWMSESLRAWAGPDYPMAAVVLPPLQLQLNTTWWPGFPYAGLAAHFDVMLPMSYSSYRGTDAALTYAWNHDNVVLVRQLAGDPDMPVHLAGGIADALPEVGAFVRAAEDSGAIGAGLYDLHTTRPEAWSTLRALRAD